MNQQPLHTVVLDPATEASLRSVGHISYALHAIVAVGAVLPGAQGSVFLPGLGRHHAIRLRAGYQRTWLNHLGGELLDCLGLDFAVVFVPRAAWLAGAQRPPGHAGLIFLP